MNMMDEKEVPCAAIGFEFLDSSPIAYGFKSSSQRSFPDLRQKLLVSIWLGLNDAAAHTDKFIVKL